MSAMNENKMKTLKVVLPLSLLYALYYVVPLGFRLLWQPDETRYAEISREMLASGDWLVPHFLDLRYFEKPVAGYWINNISQWLFGCNNFSVRFGSVFSTTASALMVYWMAWQQWQQHKTALIAAVIFLSSLLVYGVGSYAVLDPMVTMWITAAMCSFWMASQVSSVCYKVGYYILLGLACGMGFMTKGLLALVVPVVAVLPWVTLHQRWKEVIAFAPVAILSAVVICLPWGLTIAQREPDFWHYFFWTEHIQRFFHDDAQHVEPFWYYLPYFMLGSLPWLGLLPGSLWCSWQQRHQHSGRFYLLGWVIMPLLFFSIGRGKLITYILPCFAPLAILMAGYTQKLMATNGLALRCNGWINLLFGMFCTLIVVVLLAPWGLSNHTLYGENEVMRVMLAAGAFLLWGVAGGVSLKSRASGWVATALCPLGLALVLSEAIPQKVVDSKQPQSFIEAIRKDIDGSRYILADSVGVAAALGWELKRSNVLLFDAKGELAYGLAYPDAQQRFVDADAFADWLSLHRCKGSVSLILMLSAHATESASPLPDADLVYRQGRFILYHYNRKT